MNEIKRLEKEKNKAVSQGKWKEAGEYCNCIGATLSDLGQYDDALKSHQEELEFNTMIQNHLGMAIANRKIGECYAALNNFKKALHHVNLFLELSKSIGSGVEEQRAWATLGRTYYMKYKNETDPEIANKARDHSENASLCALNLLDEIKSELTAQDYAQAKSRILLNVGLIFEDQDISKCAENIRLAIYWASKYDLYEDLNRCQYTLADVYRKHEQYSHALRLLDGAIETAERLRNKTLICDSLSSKANILLALNDFEGGKQCYKKAYKVRYPNKDEHEKVVRCLKICTGLCISLKELENSDDCCERKQLFEKMADGLSSLECYKQALHYYQKTLNCLEELDCAALEKAPIYFSIAETYRDLGQNDKAIEYFNKELICNENKPHDQVKTLWEMADLYEEQQDLPKCEKLLIKASSIVEAASIDKLIVQALEKLALFYEKNSMHSKLEDIKTKLKNPKYGNLSDDEESGTLNESENPFDDVIISESEEEEVEKSKLYPRRRRQRQKPINKKNLKGETPLHEACIDGDLTYVKMLIENGVNVNVRDNAGWTPLHEACNWGHYTIVEYLLEKGANINDRGGKRCYGVTPLHDACDFGHLNIVQLLLSKGAHPTVLDDEGRSALHKLLVWKHNEGVLDEQTLNQCVSIENILKTKMEQAGQDLEIKSADSSYDHAIPLSNLPSTQLSRMSDKRSRSPSISSDDNSSDEDISNSSSPKQNGTTSRRDFEWDDPQEGASEYKNVMSSLRRSAKTVTEEIFPKTKTLAPPAFISEDKVVDKWLIMDTGNRPKSKKRKMSDLNVRKSKSITQHFKTKDKVPDNNLISISDESQDFIIDDASNDQQSESSLNKDVQPETTTETSERNINETPNLPFYLKVKICDKLILVPILEETTSVSDLAEEAAQRYHDIFGNHPVLRLTKLGALLRDSDIVKNFFANNEEVMAFVESWVEQSMEESYAQLCKKNKLVPLSDIKTELANCDKEIKFSTCLIPFSHLNLLFSAMSKCSKLQYLDLSGIVISDSCFDHLITCFPVFQNLILLNVNCCSITFESVKKMSQYLIQQKEHCKKLPKLETLNLGNNMLFSKCNSYLHTILQLPSLTTVCLNYCNLDSHFFEDSEMCASLKNCEKLEEFDISRNDLGCDGVGKVLSFLPKRSLKKLNLSYTVSKSIKMGLQISKFLSNQLCSLKEINLEGCHLRDDDLHIFSECLSYCPELQIFNISLNPRLSADAICTFLKSTFFKNNHLVHVILTSTCPWDTKSVSMLSDALKLKTFGYINLNCIPKYLQLDLFGMWREIHCDKAVCVSLSSMSCELKVN